jgi:hypothetical protein
MTSRNSSKRKITAGEFSVLVQPLLGLPIARTKRGDGSLIFLEIGELTETIRQRGDGTTRLSIRGEYTLMIEWSWRVERLRSIWFGSFNSQRQIDNRLEKLVGLTIENIGVEGRLPEIVVALSNKMWVHSFMTTDGQPDWILFFNDRKSPDASRQWIFSQHGHLYLEP